MSELDRFIAKINDDDARSAARARARELEDDRRNAVEAGLRERLQRTTERLASALSQKRVPYTVRIVTTAPRQRTALELWRGLSKADCTQETIMVEGWKFDDSESERTDSDSGRLSFNAEGMFLDAGGAIHKYSMTRRAFDVPGALRYDTGIPWGKDDAFQNGPLQSIGSEEMYNQIMLGLARLSMLHQVAL